MKKGSEELCFKVDNVVKFKVDKAGKARLEFINFHGFYTFHLTRDEVKTFVDKMTLVLTTKPGSDDYIECVAFGDSLGKNSFIYADRVTVPFNSDMVVDTPVARTKLLEFVKKVDAYQKSI
jgi:hypothetical protein